MADGNWRTKAIKKRDNWRENNQSENENFDFSSGSRRKINNDLSNNDNSNVRKNIPNKSHQRQNSHNDKPNAINNNDLLNPNVLNDLINNQTIEQVSSYMMANMELYANAVSAVVSDEILIKLVQLVAKACQITFVATKSYMLKLIMKNQFNRVNGFFSTLVVNEKKNPKFWQNIGDVLNDFAIVLENALQLIPMTSWEYVQSAVSTINVILPVIQKEKQVLVSKAFKQKMAVLKEDTDKIERKFKKVEIPTKTSYDIIEVDPDTDYRLENIYPTLADLVTPERSYVRKNIVKGEYHSIKEYLDIHFRLLREDFFNPIREDMCDYLNKTTRRLFNIKIYKNVVFLKKDIIKSVVCFQINIQLPKGLQEMIKNHENVKRFMHGALLLFSDDNFATMFCGKVLNTDELSQGLVYIDIPYNNDLNLRPQFNKTYSMIECVIYFEPYYQVLKVLQRVPQKQLPMQQYILNVQTKTKSRPKYMEKVESYDLPNGLNPSQVDALNAALNKEFVIIQGPPGTGKTFLGIKLVEQFLKLAEFWKESGPILVICFTNHALEQFLEGLYPSSKKIVRLGRQSQDLATAELKYGPLGQLKQILQEEADNRDLYRYCGLSANQTFEQDFKGILKHFLYGAPISCIRKNNDHNELVKIMNLVKIPLDLRVWLREMGYKNKSYRTVKASEEKINELKYLIEEINCDVKNGIFFSISLFPQNENNLGKTDGYNFNQIEFICWLLCDDGSIEMEQHHKKYGYNDLEEQNKIYYILSNMSEEIFGKEFFDVSYMNQLAYELAKFIKENPDDPQIKQEELDYLLNKVVYLQTCLKTDFGKPEVNFNDFPHPFMIQSKHRWQFYNNLLKNFIIKKHLELDQLYIECEEGYEMYNDLKEMENVRLLKKMDIIGMTTTCAARLRAIIEALHCPIVVVEEAAEVLESHIVTALTNSSQHLILLGDHQQLRPTTSDHVIGNKYKLGISLFERMVNNNVQCHTLNVQHRMRPEISSLISPLIYKDLMNSESVINYPPISGVDTPLYFIDHNEPEQLYGDSSKMNIHEATFLIQLAVYFLNNGYKPEDITILATYLGQSYILKKEKDQCLHPQIKNVNVTVVDNFQGEENKIILLSLVRSNKENNVGFLAIENRVCVALSRAREGLYIMGNLTQLCEATDIWKSIRSTLESLNAVGRFLTLRCKNHHKHVTLVSRASDFSKVREGGCNKPCNTQLTCSHTCIRICHGYDKDHEQYVCRNPCLRLLCEDKNHKCKKLCSDVCGPCNYLVIRTLPCGHTKTMPCSNLIETEKCDVEKEIRPLCGHIQMIPCQQDMESFLCRVESEKVLSKCGHYQNVPCHDKVEAFACNYKVKKTLSCGHIMETKCYLDIATLRCIIKCPSSLSCGHACQRKCHKNDDSNHWKYKCTRPCNKNMEGCSNPEKHPKCPNICSARCRPCQMGVTKTYENCKHFENIYCYQTVKSKMPCLKMCNKKLVCGHLCLNKCSQRCGPCNKNVFKTIPRCGHNVKVKCGVEITSLQLCKQSCTKILRCGHKCTKKCNEPCTKVCVKKCKKLLE